MLKFLITGFKPYLKHSFNSSEELVKLLSSQRKTIEKEFKIKLYTLTLKVSYRDCEKRFLRKFQKIKPDIVLSFGMSSKTRKVKIERIALNIDDSELPDVDGEVRKGKKIVKDGPAAYFATIPVEKLHEELVEAKIPSIISNHPGTYVCNHLFYYGLYTIEKLERETKMGFIHLPKFRKFGKNTLELLMKTGKICIKVCGKNFKQNFP